MADRTKFRDKNHALLVLNGLGRYHAMGHILLKQGFTSKDDYRKHPLGRNDPLLFNLFGGGLKQLCNVMEHDWPHEWNNIATRLKAQVGVVMEKFNLIHKSTSSEFQTICHGDCWTCNMMFKYCPYDEKVPVAVKFVDFQAPFVGTNIYDVTFFLYTSVLYEVRKTYYDELIAEYHKSLKSTLTDYGVEADAPTLEQVHAGMKQYKYYGAIANLVLMPIALADEDMAMKIEHLNEGCDGMNAYPPGMFNSDRYKAAVQDAIKDYLEEGLF